MRESVIVITLLEIKNPGPSWRSANRWRGPGLVRGGILRALLTLADLSRSWWAADRVKRLRHLMAKPPKPDTTALTVRERILLFCIGSGTDWQRAGVTSETVTALW